MPRETSAFSVSEQGLVLAAPPNTASGAPKAPLFVKADIKSGVFGEPPHCKRTLLNLKLLSSLAEESD